MRLFGSDRIARWMDKIGAEEGEVITRTLVTRAIEQAQKRVELQNFQARKRLLEYDDVMNQQREVIYSLRLFALEGGEELKAEARQMIAAALDRAVRKFLAEAERPEEYDRGGLRERCTLQYLVMPDAVAGPRRRRRDLDVDGGGGAGRGRGRVHAQGRLPPGVRAGDRRSPTWTSRCCPRSCSRCSTRSGRTTSTISTSSATRSTTAAWGQKDPLVEYKKEAYEMFVDLMRDIQSTFTERFLKIQVSAEPPRARRRLPPPSAAAARDRTTCSRPRRGQQPADAGTRRPRSRQLARAAGSAAGGSCRKWAGTIPVPAGRERNTRSATGRGRERLRSEDVRGER